MCFIALILAKKGIEIFLLEAVRKIGCYAVIRRGMIYLLHGSTHLARKSACENLNFDSSLSFTFGYFAVDSSRN